jgi:hypothetical protein
MRILGRSVRVSGRACSGPAARMVGRRPVDDVGTSSPLGHPAGLLRSRSCSSRGVIHTSVPGHGPTLGEIRDPVSSRRLPESL